jgi:hypothetical protein
MSNKINTKMKKHTFIVLILFLFTTYSNAQFFNNYELGVGARIQKTEQLYWENGVTADFTSDFLLKKNIHLKLSYVTSRIGSAFNTNAIKQDNYIIGADWRFRTNKNFQIFAGLNTGFFHADMENIQFYSLPHNSMLFGLETGLYYKFKFPVTVSLSVGYNLINGDGIGTPGTLFPVFYQMSILYNINKK